MVTVSCPKEGKDLIQCHHINTLGSPGGSVVKNPPANAGGAREAGSMPGSERSPGVGNGDPLKYSCLENSVRGTLTETTHPGQVPQ